MVTATKCKEAFLPIAPATLLPSAVTSFSLYLCDDSTSGFRLYRDPGCPFEEEDRQRLVENGVEQLYILAADRDRYQEYLRSNLHRLVNDERVSVRDRFAGMNEVVRTVLQESFLVGNANATADAAVEMAENLIGLVCHDDMVIEDLLSVVYHDYQTFTHSANVAYFTVFLARRLGMTGRDDLERIAAAGLIHDFGKLDIPERILAKQGPLTEEEFDVVRQHPTTGFRALCHREDLSFGQLMLVYQHHENWQGGGYPVGLVGEEIHPWSRICAVADVFEALTSHRPYRRGMSPQEAIGVMEEKMQKKFEPEVFQCLKSAIEIV